jgi:hypothetical protein
MSLSAPQPGQTIALAIVAWHKPGVGPHAAIGTESPPGGTRLQVAARSLYASAGYIQTGRGDLRGHVVILMEKAL